MGLSRLAALKAEQSGFNKMTTRRLAAILAADVAGFSALMELDEEGTFARIGTLRREVIEPRLSEHQGRLIKTTGDGFLIEFASPIAALRCALAIQGNLTNDPDALRLRIGINLGDVIIEESGDVYGEGVNVAARLEGLADPGGILISDKIHREVEGKVEASFEDRGEQQVKNITRPVHIYAVHVPGSQLATAAVLPAPGKYLALPDKPSIAVLPFQNLSDDPEQEYFADGMVEEVITALSRFKSLFVIARNSSFTYKGRAVDIKQVGRELGVRYVLEGSVRKSGSGVRITSQLIDAATGGYLWADRFDGGLEDVFSLQDQVATKVVGAIAPTLERVEMSRAKLKPTENLNAYDYFLRGLAHHYRYDREATVEALKYFYKAIESDPNFASAYGRAAIVYIVRNASSWMDDRKQETLEGIRLARLSAELGRDDAYALCAAGFALTFLGYELDAGVALIDQAILLNPNLAVGWHTSGWVRIYIGEPEMAIAHLARGMRLSPVDPDAAQYAAAMSFALRNAGRYEESISWAEKALHERPNFVPALRSYVASSALAGRIVDAQRAMSVLLKDYPHRISDFPKGRLRRPEDYAKLTEGLRIAGMPE